MDVLLLRPAVGRVPTGNRVTAVRWACLWRSLGHRVRIANADDGRPADLVVALHAVKCGAAFVAARDRLPRARGILALAGTDLPPCDAKARPEAHPGTELDPQLRMALERADTIVLLQPRQGDGLPATLRERTHVVLPSARRVAPRPPADRLPWLVLCLAHLRPIKEPFLLARAMALLPPASKLKALHLGAALTEDATHEAERAAALSPRWSWGGVWPRAHALAQLAVARALVLTSHSEGASGAIVEALVHGVPVLATDIPANLALLGADWPARFPPGDERALAALLTRLESDDVWRDQLERRAALLAPRFTQERERADWAGIFAQLGCG